MAEERFQVAVLDDYEKFSTTVPAYREAAKVADIRVLNKKLDSDRELAEAIGDADAVMLVRERSTFGEREFAMAPSLRLISQIGRAVPHLDLEGATRRRIVVSGTPGDSGISTVELTFALMLALARRVPSVDQGMHRGEWPPLLGVLLEGKTLGVIGLGRIGKQVARIAQAFGMDVVAAGKTLTDERAREAGVSRVSLEALLERSDVVSVHCRSNAETKGLLGDKELAKMKPGAFLINTSRGPIISEQALIACLEQGHLGGVGLDVFDVEPLPADHPLRRFDKAVLMSHRGYGVDQILHQRYECAFQNITNFINGEPTEVMNPEALKSSG